MAKHSKELIDTMLEGIYIHRWNKDKTSITAVLTEKETMTICKNILEDLDKAGYEILKKDTHSS